MIGHKSFTGGPGGAYILTQSQARMSNGGAGATNLTHQS